MPNIAIHGPGAEHYTDQPPITASLSYGSVRRSGNTISVDVSLSLNGLGGYNYFGYNLDLYARLDNGSWVFLCSKGNSPSQWGAGAIYGSGTPSSTNGSEACTLQIGLSSICGCHAGAPILPVYSVALAAPPSGYTVTFKGHTGIVLKTQKVAKGGSATPPAHPTRSGYTANGWSGDYTNVTSNRTCIAQYIQNKYPVKYNLNGGAGIFPSQIKLGGETLKLLSSTPSYPVTITFDGNEGIGTSKTVYREFLGWKCSANGGMYQPGDDYTSNASCTMTAQWQTVSVDLTQTQPVEPKKSKLTINWMDRIITVKEEIRSHEFIGWFTDPLVGEHVTNVDLSNNIRYYAHWADVRILPVQIVPNKTDWNFVDFYTDSIYTPSRRVTTASMMSSSMTIYAKWSYNVKMYGNGGSLWSPTFPNVGGVIESKDVDVLVKQHGVPLTFPDYTIDYKTSASGDSVVEKDGQSKDFVNWNSKQDGSGIAYPKVYTYNTNDCAYFYAQWKTKNFKVIFRDGYKNDNSGIIATFTVPYGGSVSKAQVTALGTPKRDGYSFSGWRGSYTNVRSDVTVVAVWNFSPIWIFVSDGFGGHWQGYEPEE